MPIPLPEVTEETSTTPPHGDALARPPAAVPAESAVARPAGVPALPTEGGIGLGGERLTRQEAFSLVGRAVAALTSGDRAVPASLVREKAFELLGRDSESLSERNFVRILKDAHDGDAIDLRRRGDDYEVAVAAQAAPVAEQLNRASAAISPSARPPAPPPVPRGMGPRSAGGRGRGPIGRPVAEVPPDLLLLGVVEEPSPAPDEVPAVASVSDATGAAETAEAAPAPRRSRGGRKKAPAKKTAVKTTRAAAASPTPAPEATATTGPSKPRRGRARKKAAAATGEA